MKLFPSSLRVTRILKFSFGLQLRNLDVFLSFFFNLLRICNPKGMVGKTAARVWDSKLLVHIKYS